MNFVSQKKLMSKNAWDDIEEDPFKTLSKDEMDALRAAKPRNFASINSGG